MTEKSNLGQANDCKKKDNRLIYTQKHKLCRAWIKEDLKLLLQRIGDGSTTKGSEILLNELLKDGSICKLILTNKPD